MKKIVECVPNFSEGRNSKKIRKITDEIMAVAGVSLLNVEPNPEHNRTVITFVGDPEAVKNAAFRAIAKASELIDMALHHGEHPRIGACDVCPFVPVQNVTMEECVILAQQLGIEVGERLGIPAYLYEEAATRPERRNLATIRQGEYEGLEEKLKDPHWQPDFGPAVFNRKSGAIVIGARLFLIAYNVNLGTEDPKIGEKIAGIIRESGRIVKREQRTIRIPGCLKAVKAFGLKDIAQVSMNLTDFKVTPLHIAYEIIHSLAGLAGVSIIDSEIVGLVPKEAMLDAGRFYLPDEASETEFIASAVKNLRIKEFLPENKIIEFLLARLEKEENNE